MLRLSAQGYGEVARVQFTLGQVRKKKTKPAISDLSCFAGLMADLNLEMLKFGREKTKQKYYVRENFTGHCG